MDTLLGLFFDQKGCEQLGAPEGQPVTPAIHALGHKKRLKITRPPF
jgi:hypothetical protein